MLKDQSIFTRGGILMITDRARRLFLTGEVLAIFEGLRPLPAHG
jgi:hypothetical protein